MFNFHVPGETPYLARSSRSRNDMPENNNENDNTLNEEVELIVKCNYANHKNGNVNSDKSNSNTNNDINNNNNTNNSKANHEQSRTPTSISKKFTSRLRQSASHNATPFRCLQFDADDVTKIDKCTKQNSKLATTVGDVNIHRSNSCSNNSINNNNSKDNQCSNSDDDKNTSCVNNQESSISYHSITNTPALVSHYINELSSSNMYGEQSVCTPPQSPLNHCDDVATNNNDNNNDIIVNKEYIKCNGSSRSSDISNKNCNMYCLEEEINNETVLLGEADLSYLTNSSTLLSDNVYKRNTTYDACNCQKQNSAQ